MRWIEAVLFACASPIEHTDLPRVVGLGAAVNPEIADLADDLGDRSYEMARVGAGWMPRR